MVNPLAHVSTANAQIPNRFSIYHFPFRIFIAVGKGARSSEFKSSSLSLRRRQTATHRLELWTAGPQVERFPPMTNEKWKMTYGTFFSSCSDSELLSQPQLQPVHLPRIGGVVVATKVNHAMKNKLRDFFVEAYPILARLAGRLL